MSWIFAFTLSIRYQKPCFPSEGLNEDLHTTIETEDRVEGKLLLDVVVQKGTPVFKLFSSEDEALLVWGNAVWHISFLPSFCSCRVGTLRNFEVL